MIDIKQSRDRPYLRHVYVKKEDSQRMREIIAKIPRKKVLRVINAKDDTYCFTIQVKTQELLMMTLMFKWIHVERPRKPSIFRKSHKGKFT